MVVIQILILLYMKLNISNITCILDNDTSKQNSFYGSSLICKSPNIIKEIDNPMIICYIGCTQGSKTTIKNYK